MEIKLTIAFDERALGVLEKLADAITPNLFNTPVEADVPQKAEEPKKAKAKKAPEPVAEVAKVEEVEETITIEAIRALAADKRRDGKLDGVKEVMGQFGIALLHALKPEQLEDFHAAIAAL